MNNKDRLIKLKLLRVSEDEKKKRFSTLEKLSAWADEVAPLLKYDKDHYETFLEAVNTAKMPLSGALISYHLSISISVVNQAIIELENKIESYWSPSAVKKIWYDSFWGKVLVSVTASTIMIFIGAIIAIFVSPVFQGLAKPKEQPQQLLQKQQNTNQDVLSIPENQQKTYKERP
jgi:ABC-type phosphate/phosphonate transport system permease subunit